MEDEFEKIYNDYYPRIYSFLFKICNNHQICEEMTQETFYKAYSSYSRYKGESSLFTYLAGIAKNVYFNYLRKHRVETVDIDLVVVNSVDENDPYTVLEKKYESERIWQLVSELPKNYGDVVFLRIYAELSYEQIAKMLKISESSAKVIFFRAKKMLKEALLNDTM